MSTRRRIEALERQVGDLVDGPMSFEEALAYLEAHPPDPNEPPLSDEEFDRGWAEMVARDEARRARRDGKRGGR